MNNSYSMLYTTSVFLFPVTAVSSSSLRTGVSICVDKIGSACTLKGATELLGVYIPLALSVQLRDDNDGFLIF